MYTSRVLYYFLRLLFGVGRNQYFAHWSALAELHCMFFFLRRLASKPTFLAPLICRVQVKVTWLYYINTSKIPSELCCENFISSHVKITCSLHTWRDIWYWYVKRYWYFTGVYIINKILHTRLSLVSISLYLSCLSYEKNSFYLIQQVLYVVSFALSICTGGFHKVVSMLWIFFVRQTRQIRQIQRYGNQALWIWILSSRVQLDISRVSAANEWDIELTTRR